MYGETMENVLKKLRQFRDDRDWAQFHNPKDLAIALSIEASELLEVYLWKAPDAPDTNKVKEELADVFAYALLLSDVYGFNIPQIIQDKIAQNKIPCK